MGKRRSRPYSDTEEQESDVSEKVSSRKKKASVKKETHRDDKGANSDTAVQKSIKKPKFDVSSKEQRVIVHKSDEGDGYIELGKKKRATVRTFKGQTLIDIREFYGDEGEERPGKKGISLTAEQWQALRDGQHMINDLIAKLESKKET